MVVGWPSGGGAHPKFKQLEHWDCFHDQFHFFFYRTSVFQKQACDLILVGPSLDRIFMWNQKRHVFGIHFHREFRQEVFVNRGFYMLFPRSAQTVSSWTCKGGAVHVIPHRGGGGRKFRLVIIPRKTAWFSPETSKAKNSYRICNSEIFKNRMRILNLDSIFHTRHDWRIRYCRIWRAPCWDSWTIRRGDRGSGERRYCNSIDSQRPCRILFSGLWIRAIDHIWKCFRLN